MVTTGQTLPHNSVPKPALGLMTASMGNKLRIYRLHDMQPMGDVVEFDKIDPLVCIVLYWIREDVMGSICLDPK